MITGGRLYRLTDLKKVMWKVMNQNENANDKHAIKKTDRKSF